MNTIKFKKKQKNIMETTTLSGVSNIYGVELARKTTKVVEKIKSFVKEQHLGTQPNYKLQVKPEFFGLYIEELKIMDLSKTKQKELNKILFHLEERWNIRNMNRLLHFIGKYVTNTPSLKIDKCKKEQDIQMKRKAWLKARNEADALLKAYKEEKGDFYK